MQGAHGRIDLVAETPTGAPFNGVADGQAGGRSQALRDCLSELPAKSRELLKMRYFDGQRCEEVAASLNTKLDAIYKRLSRLHQALKFCIETKLTQAPS